MTKLEVDTAIISLLFFLCLIAHNTEIFPIRLDFSHDQTAIDPIIFCLNIKGLKNDESHIGRPYWSQ